MLGLSGCLGGGSVVRTGQTICRVSGLTFAIFANVSVLGQSFFRFYSGGEWKVLRKNGAAKKKAEKTFGVSFFFLLLLIFLWSGFDLVPCLFPKGTKIISSAV